MQSFNLLVEGAIPTTEMPCYLRGFDDDVFNNETLTFTAEPGNMAGEGDFKINDNKYSMPREESTIIQVDLNSQGEWILNNCPIMVGNKKKAVTHPFHIHVNPFQVVKRGDVEVPVSDRIWQDTVAVDPGIPLKILHRFEDYNGTFVLHCHILIHEDQGMMFDVKVKDPNNLGHKPGEEVTLDVCPYSPSSQCTT